jgi:hypothetical protein
MVQDGDHIILWALAIGDRHPSFSAVGSMSTTYVQEVSLCPIGDSRDSSSLLAILIFKLFLRLFFVWEKYRLADTMRLDSTGTCTFLIMESMSNGIVRTYLRSSLAFLLDIAWDSSSESLKFSLKSPASDRFTARGSVSSFYSKVPCDDSSLNCWTELHSLLSLWLIELEASKLSKSGLLLKRYFCAKLTLPFWEP